MKSLNFNYISFCLLTSCFFMLTGCGNKPEDTVEEYLDNTFLNNNGKRAYRLLSSNDKKYTSEKEFSAEIKRKNIFNNKFFKKHKNEFNYEILETRYLGDTVLVKVSLTKPNTKYVLNEMVTIVMTASLSEMNEEERSTAIQQQFGKIIKNRKIENDVEEREFILIKENGRYKIYLNLEHPA